MMILKPEPVRLGHQRVEILERAEHRIDVAVVGHVVAHVGHRRLEEGRQPDGVDAERGDMGKPGGDAAQVADAIAVVSWKERG